MLPQAESFILKIVTNHRVMRNYPPPKADNAVSLRRDEGINKGRVAPYLKESKSLLLNIK